MDDTIEELIEFNEDNSFINYENTTDDWCDDFQFQQITNDLNSYNYED